MKLFMCHLRLWMKRVKRVVAYKWGSLLNHCIYIIVEHVFAAKEQELAVQTC